VGQRAFGVRTELKNINSFRFVKKAIEFEVARHEAVISTGGSIVQETRTWNEAQGRTLSMRGKEEAHDYRYFPDPDLPPLRLSSAEVEDLRAQLPSLPDQRRRRWITDLGLSPYDAEVLTGHPVIADLFEATASALEEMWGAAARAEAGKKAANFIQSEVLRQLRTDGLQAELPTTAESLAELLGLVRDGTINGKIAKEVFGDMVDTGQSPRAIVQKKGLSQVTDASAILEVISGIIEAHPEQVRQYREGKGSLIGFFVGQVMKATKGKANPKMVNELLRKELESA
jgi:aspartyl-tRNA(Asn)/glutamyl-tRNA(Gln) amidotransferase subunit B